MRWGFESLPACQFLMTLKFWFKWNAQKVADQLNEQYRQYEDNCFPWEVQRQGIRYLILKKYHANVSGTYTIAASKRHIGA